MKLFVLLVLSGVVGTSLGNTAGLASALQAAGQLLPAFQQEVPSQGPWNLVLTEPTTGLEIKIAFNDTSDYAKGGQGLVLLPTSPPSRLEIWAALDTGPSPTVTLAYQLRDAASLTVLRAGTLRLALGRGSLHRLDRLAGEYSGMGVDGLPEHLSVSVSGLESVSSPSPALAITASLGGRQDYELQVEVDRVARTATLSGSLAGESVILRTRLSAGEETELLLAGDLGGRPLKGRFTLETKDSWLHKLTAKVQLTGEGGARTTALDLYWLAQPAYLRLVLPGLFPGILQTLSTRGSGTNKIRAWRHNSGVWWVPEGGAEEDARPVISDYRKDGRTIAFNLHNTEGMEYFFNFQWQDDALLRNSAAMLVRSDKSTKVGLVWDLSNMDRAQVFHKVSEDDQGRRSEVTHEVKWSLAKGMLRSRVFYVSGNGDGSPLPESREAAEAQALPYGKVLTTVGRRPAGAFSVKLDAAYSPKKLTAKGALRFRKTPEPFVRAMLMGQAGVHKWQLVNKGEPLTLPGVQRLLDNVVTSLETQNGLALLRGELV